MDHYSTSMEALPALPGHAGSHAGLNGYARRPVKDSLRGKQDRGADAEDVDFIEDDAGGGDGDWRAMLRAVTGGYDPSKCALLSVQICYNLSSLGSDEAAAPCFCSMMWCASDVQNGLKQIASSAACVCHPAALQCAIGQRRAQSRTHHGVNRKSIYVCTQSLECDDERPDVVAARRAQGTTAPLGAYHLSWQVTFCQADPASLPGSCTQVPR